MKKWVVLVVALVVVPLLVLSCAKPAPTPPLAPTPTPAPTPPPAAPSIVKIGGTYGLSGPMARYSIPNMNGVLYGIDDINADGGITVAGKKYMFEHVCLDDRGEATEVVSNIRSLVGKGIKVIFVAGMYGHAPAMEINEEESFLLCSQNLDEKIEAVPNKLSVLMNTKGTAECYTYMEVFKEAGLKKAAIIQCSFAPATEQCDRFESLWPAEGGEIVGRETIDIFKETDFYPYLTKLLPREPDLLFLWTPSESAALIIGQARELGYTGCIYIHPIARMGDVADILGAWDKLGYITGAGPLDKWPGVMPAFIERYRETKHYKEMPCGEIDVVLYYTMIQLIAKSMEKAGTVDDVYAIRAAMPEVLPLPEKINPVGAHSIKPHSGKALTEIWFCAYKDGEFIYWHSTLEAPD